LVLGALGLIAVAVGANYIYSHPSPPKVPQPECEEAAHEIIGHVRFMLSTENALRFGVLYGDMKDLMLDQAEHSIEESEHLTGRMEAMDCHRYYYRIMGDSINASERELLTD
jgi:hypothetical protein